MRFLIGMIVGMIASIVFAVSMLNIPTIQEELTSFGNSLKHSLEFLDSSVHIIQEANDPAESPAFPDELQTAPSSSYHPEEIEPAPEDLEQEVDRSSLDEEAWFQPVWIPFRSEVSARGFAKKLQQQTEAEFQVRKIGAGRYEVGFLYDSKIERSSILNSVYVLTGFKSRPESGGAKAMNPDLLQLKTVQRQSVQR